MAKRNRTKSDAFNRVYQARLGSLNNPNMVYLLALREELQLWINRVDDAIVEQDNLIDTIVDAVPCAPGWSMLSTFQKAR